jgi:hypothetical protein
MVCTRSWNDTDQASIGDGGKHMPSRRAFLQAATGAAAAGLTVGLRGVAVGAAAGGRLPTITGPITGGQHGWAFGAYFGDIGTRGYVEEEYFIEGHATPFKLLGERTPDGKWSVEPLSAVPYKTRIVVQRPLDPKKFNGTVVVEWTNVSAGFDNFFPLRSIYDGFAYVAVSAQRYGVHGFKTNPSGLLQWDPQRYGSLSIPGDSLSYDIYSQAARLVAPGQKARGINPLGGLKVRKAIAIGLSQSGARLMSYINAIQPREKIFNAMMPIVCGGTSAYFEDDPPDAPATGTPQDTARYIPTKVREDLAVPVMAVNSETEARVHFPVRQPDTARYVYWEVPGASHAGGGGMDGMREKLQRDAPKPRTSQGSGPAATHPSDVAWKPTAEAALVHVQNWIDSGKTPPSQKLMEISGAPPVIARDEYGNALGGIRLPELEVPIARYEGFSATGSISGQTYPFTAEQIKQLYPTHEIYVEKIKAAAQAAERAQVILAYRVAEYIAKAEAAAVPV